jgi:hypothetical protein
VSHPAAFQLGRERTVSIVDRVGIDLAGGDVAADAGVVARLDLPDLLVKFGVLAQQVLIAELPRVDAEPHSRHCSALQSSLESWDSFSTAPATIDAIAITATTAAVIAATVTSVGIALIGTSRSRVIASDSQHT